MAPKVIKLGKKDDIPAVVRQLKSLKDREVVFEIANGSVLLTSSDNLKLLKRTGEALGKKVFVSTEDEIGKILAKKAGVLVGDTEVKMPKASPVRVSRSDVKPRFSDILGSRKISLKHSEVDEEPRIFITPKVSQPVHHGKPSRRFFKLFVFSIVILVVVVFALAVILPKATITAFARSEQVARDLEIKVDKSVSKVDTDNLEIPGTMITKEVSQTKNFPTTGKNLAGTKATGSIVLFNFTTHTLTLKASTTSLLVDGKKYLFTKDVTGIKPTSSDKSPSTGSIGIVAEKPGEDYNLPANTKFEIVNAALGNQNVYAVNTTEIKGGKATATAVLSQEDMDRAVEVLTEDILNQAETDLSAESGTKIRLILSGVNREILAKTANKNVGEATDNFDMTLIAKVTGLSFRDQDVKDLVTTKINQVLSSDKYLLDEGKSEYDAKFRNLDLKNGNGVLQVHFTTVAAYKVDENNLSKILAGKTESEIKEILLSKPEIDDVKVEFWPAWFVHKAPRLNGKVYIKSVISE